MMAIVAQAEPIADNAAHGLVMKLTRGFNYQISWRYLPQLDQAAQL